VRKIIAANMPHERTLQSTIAMVQNIRKLLSDAEAVAGGQMETRAGGEITIIYYLFIY
jgi:hypothetical protein